MLDPASLSIAAYVCSVLHSFERFRGARLVQAEEPARAMSEHLLHAMVVEAAGVELFHILWFL
jgi:hypothetical protein